MDVLQKDIIQSNPLIEARKHMNVTEMRLFGLGLSDITPHIKDDHVHDLEFHDTWITYTDLVRLFNSSNGGNISNLKKQIIKAYQGYIELSNPEGGFKLRHIYEEMEYYPKKGLLIRFHEKLKPYILDLVGKAYTVYKLNLLFLLSSEYSQRLMELLLEKQGYLKKQDRVYRELSIEEIRYKLNVPDGKYANRIDNFKCRVLDEPIKEINKKTDYFVWYEARKTGRKITGFRIWMKYKEDRNIKKLNQEKALPALCPAHEPTSAAESDKKNLVNAMLAEGMTKAAINTWIKRDGLDDVKKSFSLAVKHANERTGIKSKGKQRAAYIKACMERNIAAANDDDARLKAEIDAREKRLAEEKKADIAATEAFFSKVGVSADRQGSGLQSIGSLLGADKPQETPEAEELAKKPPKDEPKALDAATVETILKLWEMNGNEFSGDLVAMLAKYGYDKASFLRRYYKELLSR